MERNTTTTILIESAHDRAINDETGVETKVRRVGIVRNSKRPHLRLSGKHNLTNTEDVKVYLQSPEMWKTVKLSEELRLAIVEYLQLSKQQQAKLNCHSFAGMVLGGVDIFSNKEYGITHTAEKVEEAKEPGDVITTVDPMERSLQCGFKHAAIYLGKGLYISLYGDGGGLIVSTLEEMQKMYGGEEVYLIKAL